MFITLVQLFQLFFPRLARTEATREQFARTAKSQRNLRGSAAVELHLTAECYASLSAGCLTLRSPAGLDLLQMLAQSAQDFFPLRIAKFISQFFERKMDHALGNDTPIAVATYEEPL